MMIMQESVQVLYQRFRDWGVKPESLMFLMHLGVEFKTGMLM